MRINTENKQNTGRTKETMKMLDEKLNTAGRKKAE